MAQPQTVDVGTVGTQCPECLAVIELPVTATSQLNTDGHPEISAHVDASKMWGHWGEHRIEGDPA